jgi:hypothetical protein
MPANSDKSVWKVANFQFLIKFFGAQMDRKLTILLAEDDEDYALVLKKAIETNGWKNPVQIVPDGKE